MKLGNYRLALDVGTNSLGWALIRLDDKDTPAGIIRLGSRIFSDGRHPKSGESLGALRRQPRQMRRMRDRTLRRQSALIRALVSVGLMPEDPNARKALQNLNPYALRSKGLNEALTPYEMGRALFQLGQRRGFKSNRRTDKAAGDEKGKIALGGDRLRQAMAASSHETLGAYLHHRREQGQSIRARLTGQGKASGYDLYAQRDMVADEFDLLWMRQAALDPLHYTPEAADKIKGIMLHQRPLRPVEPGRCTLEPSDRRLPSSHPLTQRLRILQDLNHMRYTLPGQTAQALSLEQRDTLSSILLCQGSMAFTAMKKSAGIPRHAQINLESERRDKLVGDETAAVLSKPAFFGPAWHEFDLETQGRVVMLLLDAEDEREVIAQLGELGVSADKARHISEHVVLRPGYGRLGKSAALKVCAALQADVIAYANAVQMAGYTDHYKPDDEIMEALPYYGSILTSHVGGSGGDPGNEESHFGKIANPTVHIALNQLRRIVNEIIARYGHPRQIAIELARELKLSRDQKADRDRQQTKNHKANDRYAQEIRDAGFRATAESMLRMRLWHELSENPIDRVCVYTGRHISRHDLLSENGGTHIDHILPFSRTLDDSVGNKVLCFRHANLIKGNKTPYEAFGHSPDSFDWQKILERVQELPSAKRKRFDADSLSRYVTKDGTGDFLARQLTDTAYLARVARQYLECICPRGQIWNNTGHLTAMVRGKWGLNRLLSPTDRKNRNDHRHHAVDALVIGLIDRRLLQQVASAAGRAQDLQLARLIDEMPEPWPHFYATAAEAISRVVVSHKPDHGPEGKLHNDTAYGIVETNAKGESVVRHRVPVTDLKKSHLEALASDTWRQRLEGFGLHTELSDPDWKAKLAAFSAVHGVRNLRIHEAMRVIPISDATGQVYKAYKGDGNYCYELFRLPNGKWDGEVISTFEANQKPYRAFRQDAKRFRTETFSGKSLAMRLIVNDCLAIDEEGLRHIMRVVKMTQGQIVLAKNQEAGDLKRRHEDKADDFRYMFKAPGSLKTTNARKVRITSLGYVFDPGFKP